MCGAEVTKLPEGVQRVAVALRGAQVADVVLATTENVPSPCILVCRMSEWSGLCEGCFRTLDEIRLWSQSDDAAKRRLWLKVEQRAAESVS